MDDRSPCPHCAEPVPRIARKCKHCGEYLQGAGDAVDPAAGLVMSFALGTVLVALLCVVLGVAAAIVGPDVLRVRRESNERAAVEALRAIVEAQMAFQEEDADGDGAANFGSLGELGLAGKLEPDLASGLEHQYAFEVAVSTTDPKSWWMATASPITPEGDGTRYFATNHTGAIYFRQGRPFRLDLNRCEFPPDSLPLGSLGGPQLR